MEEDVIDITGV